VLREGRGWRVLVDRRLGFLGVGCGRGDIFFPGRHFGVFILLFELIFGFELRTLFLLSELFLAGRSTFPFKVDFDLFPEYGAVGRGEESGEVGVSLGVAVVWNRRRNTVIDGFHELGENSCIFENLFIVGVAGLN
jgi:hypothetical protein